MTKITFFKKNNFTIGFEAVGHSGYAQQNSDIVCSAISTATQMTVVGLRDVLNLKLNHIRDDKKALLACKLASSLGAEEIQKAQPFFQALEISLRDIEGDYKKHLKVEVKDEIN